jgi:hypothetical protein
MPSVFVVVLVVIDVGNDILPFVRLELEEPHVACLVGLFLLAFTECQR